jgi:GTP-binding protein
VPLLTVSGKTGKGIDQLLGAAIRGRGQLVAARIHRRTQPLVRTAVETNPPPAPGASGSSCAISPR